MHGLLYKLYGLFALLTFATIGLLLYNQQGFKDVVENVSHSSSYKNVLLLNPLKQGEQPATSTKKQVETTVQDQALVLQKEIKQSSPTELQIDTVENVDPSLYKNPCKETVTYSLGTFDERFSLSKEKFLQITDNAVQTWNTAGERTFFAYVPSGGDITINLIYDERQQNTVESNFQKAEIDNTKESADTLKKEYEALKVTFAERKDVYMREVEAFTAEQKTYNDTITMWNEKGGAPQEEYVKLTVQKEKLQAESIRLQKEYTELDTILASINTKIDRYNELVRFVNAKIAQVNTLANKKFTEGHYSGASNEITIYQFNDYVKLQRVIAHEFGHALGIDHVDSESSIMYYLNNQSNLGLSTDDVLALTAICTRN